MARDYRKKMADEAQKHRNVGTVDKFSVQSTSSTESIGAVTLVNSTSAGSGLGRLVMTISDQERVDAYQVLEGTRSEIVVMMTVDSGSEVHTALVTFPWNVEQFDKTSICLSSWTMECVTWRATSLRLARDSWSVTRWSSSFQWTDWDVMGGPQLWDPCRVWHTKRDVKFPWRGRQTPSICQLVWESMVRYPGRWWQRLPQVVQRLHPLDVNWGDQVPPERCSPPPLSQRQWKRCWKTSLLGLCCLWLLCETGSRPSMVRCTARRTSCGSGSVNTRSGRNNNVVNGSGWSSQEWAHSGCKTLRGRDFGCSKQTWGSDGDWATWGDTHPADTVVPRVPLGQGLRCVSFSQSSSAKSSSDPGRLLFPLWRCRCLWRGNWSCAGEPLSDNPVCNGNGDTEPLGGCAAGKERWARVRDWAAHQLHKKARVHGIGHQERRGTCHHGTCGQALGGDQEDRCAGSSSTRENASLQLAVLGCSGQHAVAVAETSANSLNRSRDEGQVTPPHEHGGLDDTRWEPMVARATKIALGQSSRASCWGLVSKQSFAIRLERRQDETVKPSNSWEKRKLRTRRISEPGLTRRVRRRSTTWERLLASLPREPAGECRPMASGSSMQWRLWREFLGTRELVGSSGGRVTHEFKSHRCDQRGSSSLSAVWVRRKRSSDTRSSTSSSSTRTGRPGSVDSYDGGWWAVPCPWKEEACETPGGGASGRLGPAMVLSDDTRGFGSCRGSSWGDQRGGTFAPGRRRRERLCRRERLWAWRGQTSWSIGGSEKDARVQTLCCGAKAGGSGERMACSQVPLGWQGTTRGLALSLCGQRLSSPCSLGDAISSLQPITNRIVDAVAESHGWARLVADATKAFLQAAEDEDICGECPPGFKDQLAAEGEDTNVLFKFVKKCTGRPDGPQGFCDFVSGVMCQMNLIRCALPCFFWHENLRIFVELHQDDFHCTAPAESLMWLKKELRHEIRLKFSEIVYPATRYSHLKASRLVTPQERWLWPVLVTSQTFWKRWECRSALGPQRRLRRCVAATQRPMESCWKPKNTESFGEWLALLGFRELSVRALAESSSGGYPGARFRTLQAALSLSEPDKRPWRVFPKRTWRRSSWVLIGGLQWQRLGRRSWKAKVNVERNDLVGPVSFQTLSKVNVWWLLRVVRQSCMRLSQSWRTWSWSSERWAFIGLSAKMELRLDSSAARAMLERQGAGGVRHVEVAVLWAQQWVKDRGVAVRAEPTRTNCADLGTKVHSVARFRELFDMIRLRDRENLEAEASKETLPVPLPIAGVAHTFGKLDDVPLHAGGAWRSWEERMRGPSPGERVGKSARRVCCKPGTLGWADQAMLVSWFPSCSCRLRGRVTILALDPGDSVMIDTYDLTSSCRHVGSRKQCKSDQPASTPVWVYHILYVIPLCCKALYFMSRYDT